MSRGDDTATLHGLLGRAARQGDRGGIRILDRRERANRTSWREVRRRAEVAAGRLAGAGVRRGERVGLIYPTSLEFFDAFFGCLLAGATPAPIYPPVRLGRLDEYHGRTARMLRAAGVRLVLTDRRVRRVLGQTVERAELELGCRTLAELPDAGPVQTPAAPDELALVQFSSGTTVDPKPVALSHRAIVAQVEALNSFWPDDETVQHSGVSWLPLYHDMGLIGCIFTALERRADITLIPPELFVARPAIWLRTLSRFGATVSPAPNFAYGLCVDKIRDGELDGVDLSAWRVALNGAESVAPTVLRAFIERFRRWGFRPEALTPVYGLSEASLAVTFSALDRPFHARRLDGAALNRERLAVDAEGGLEIVSVGRPLPGFEVEIRDRAGARLAAHRVGRIWVRGPSLMVGYLGQPEATAAAIVEDWLDTGDLGFLDGDGELFLTGRAKDLIILRGRNLAPEAIEQTLTGVVGVRTGCALAVGHLPDGAEREEVWLFAERSRRHGRTPEVADDAVEEACREAVFAGVELRLDRVILLEPGTLPRTSSGKLRRAEALRRYLADELSAPDAIGPLQLLRIVQRSRAALRRAHREERA